MRWRGWGEDHDSWEPQANVADLIDDHDFDAPPPPPPPRAARRAHPVRALQRQYGLPRAKPLGVGCPARRSREIDGIFTATQSTPAARRAAPPRARAARARRPTMSCSAPLRTTCRIFPVRQRPPHMPRSASSGMDILASVSSLARAHEVENNWRPVTGSQVPRYTNPAHLQARGCVRGRSTGEVDAKSGRPT